MKFLISVIDDLSNSGTPAEMEAINAFNDGLRDNGQWIFAWGLQAPETATVIDNRNGANVETGKPLFDAKEHYSGLWLIEAADAETAKKLAYAASKACNRKVELRPLH
jgi:hypothetical protein